MCLLCCLFGTAVACAGDKAIAGKSHDFIVYFKLLKYPTTTIMQSITISWRRCLPTFAIIKFKARICQIL